MKENQIDWESHEADKHARENRWAETFKGEEPNHRCSSQGVGSPHPSTPRSQRQYDGHRSV